MRPFARTATTLATLLAVGAPVLTTGCGSDATSPQDQFPGAYSLRTFNGQSLPAVYDQDPTYSYSIASDVFTFNSDGTLAEQASVRLTPLSGGSAVTQSESYTGTWTLSGTTVTVQITGQGTISGTFSGGNTLTTTTTGSTLVYQK